MNASTTKQKVFSYLTGEVYEASHNPDHWQTVLGLICRLTNSNSATLLFRDHDVGRASLAFSTGFPEQVMIDYNNYYGSKDPSYALYQRMVPVGTAKACHQLVPDRDEFEALSPEFFDWMERIDRYYFAGATLFDENDVIAAIAIQRSRDRGKWSNRRMELLTELVPHIQRALKIHREFSRLKSRETALQIGLDKMVMGLVLFDHLGHVVYTNPMADTILKKHPAVQKHGERIIGTHPEDGRKLNDLVNRAVRLTSSANFEPQAIGLRGPKGGDVLPVLVTAIRPRDRLADTSGNRIRAAMYFSDPTHSHPMSPDTLIEAYGLTAAEAWVAIGIANGLSVEEVAEQSGTSINTARSQLRSIFRKTETSRQTELVKLLLTGPFCISS